MLTWGEDNLDGNFPQAIFLWEKLMEFMLFIEILKNIFFSKMPFNKVSPIKNSD